MAFFDQFRSRQGRGAKASRRYDAERSAADLSYDSPSDQAIIYRSELDYISRCILDYPDIETGGSLFGFWTSTGVPVVLYAIGPGRRAIHEHAAFHQDHDYTARVGGRIVSEFRLLHLGEWHSHHKLGLDHPSGGDIRSMQEGIGQPGFPRLLLCIGTRNGRTTCLDAYNFHYSQPMHPEHAAWDIVEIESPFRKVIDAALVRELCHPHTQRPCHGELFSRQRTAEAESPRVHWLTECVEHIEVMKSMVGDAREMFGQVATQMNDAGEPVMLLGDGSRAVVLPYGFPERSPRIEIDGAEQPPLRKWRLRGEDVEWSFVEWLSANSPLLGGGETRPPRFQRDAADKAAGFAERMSEEKKVLERFLPAGSFRMHLNERQPYVDIDVPASFVPGGYTLAVVYPGPSQGGGAPAVFVTRELHDAAGRHMYDSSEANRTIGSKRELGWTRLDVSGGREWDSSMSVLRLFALGCLWLESYDCSLRCGGCVADTLDVTIATENAELAAVKKVIENISNNR